MKEYVRKCDKCGVQIDELYDYGVTTLYRKIRIGRGHQFHDYAEGSIYNLMKQKTPDDYDTYGSGYAKDQEFSFCSPECCFLFFLGLYKDTYESSLECIKEEKEKNLDEEIAKLKKSTKKSFPYLSAIAKKWRGDHMRESAIKSIDNYIARLKKERDSLKEGAASAES